MVFVQNIKQTVLEKKTRMVAVVVLMVAVLGYTPTAQAQPCEIDTEVIAAQTSFEASQASAIAAMVSSISSVVTAETTAATTTIVTQLEIMDTYVRTSLYEFWYRWQESWKGMTAQLNASQVDQSRNIGSNDDASNQGATQRMIQAEEHEAIRDYQPTKYGCEVDTANRSYSRTYYVATGVAKGFERDITNAGTNKTGTAGAGGAATFQRQRWQRYSNNFADPNANAGNSGAVGAPPLPNADIVPSRTLFGKETLDMSTPAHTQAIQELVNNIIGFDPPPPVSPDALAAVGGQEDMLENRAFLTKMSAVAAVPAHIVGERTPGEPAPHVREQRLAAGVPASEVSPNPSKREVRQAIVENLWKPDFYIGLNDTPATARQKELYLQGYSLVMLYELIEKTERIATLFSVQGGHMLDEMDDSGDASSGTQQMQ